MIRAVSILYKGKWQFATNINQGLIRTANGLQYRRMDWKFRLHKSGGGDIHQYVAEGKAGDYLGYSPYPEDLTITTVNNFNTQWPPKLTAESIRMKNVNVPAATSQDLKNPDFLTRVVREGSSNIPATTRSPGGTVGGGSTPAVGGGTPAPSTGGGGGY